MRIALLGADDTTLAVAAAAVRSGHDQVVQAAALGTRAADAAKLIPNLRIDDDWEQLLDPANLDAVLVAADQPAARVDQLRRLIQLGIPVLVSHPLSLSMLEYYELEMIRNETNSAALAYLPARWHPAISQLAAMNQGDSALLGDVEQVVFERFLANRDRETVLRQFAVDVDLLKFIAGSATKLHAMGSPGASGTYGNLGVQITCDAGIVCRWSVAPVETQAGGRLTLIGSAGKLTLWMPQGNEPWQLETRGSVAPTKADFPHWDPPTLALEKLVALRSGGQADPTWAEAARTIELTETIDVSLKRGRTIDMHSEEFSDIGTFKGTMTSLGCGILIAGLALVVLALMVRALAAQAGWQWLVDKLDLWPYLLLVVLGIYLGLQLLVLIGKPSKLPNRQGEPHPQSAADPHDLSS